MINSIHIKNFKSIVDLSMELGAFNVLIGENGCGKSNILEAVAFGAAANADKLDQEFLGSRGIRITNPEFMFSAFKGKKTQSIKLEFNLDDFKLSDTKYNLVLDDKNNKKWVNTEIKSFKEKVTGELVGLLSKDDTNNDDEKLRKLNNYIKEIDLLASLLDDLGKISDKYKLSKDNPIVSLEISKVISSFLDSNETISNFIIYSPEQSSIRKYEETNHIYPLGIRGEGLFQYLKELATDKKNKKLLESIKNTLFLLDWYENFDLSENLMSNEFSLKIKDKYLHPTLQYFDQRSTNEGFLYLLFYATLFSSKMTPAFFAIDNIDVSFNPKMCMQLTKTLVALAKKNKKQVIVTTHNPAILDGLDLKDNDQRLFVVRRNDEGHTRLKRIEYKQERKLKLSEIWTNGFIGGLPENF